MSYNSRALYPNRDLPSLPMEPLQNPYDLTPKGESSTHLAQHHYTPKAILQRKVHPFSLFVVVLWVVFIAILAWLLEKAVASGPHDPSPPWGLVTLPSLFLTVFAQGHAAVTAMHLARVAVSSLESRSSAPNTWRELFWLADRSWQGPVGIASSVYEAFLRRIRLSLGFVMFSFTCLIALATPILWTRAYPIRPVDVTSIVTINPTTLAVENLAKVGGYAQQGTGMGSWGTGLAVVDAFNNSVYTNSSTSRQTGIDSDQFFFAGDVQGTNSTLPGLLLDGSCSPVSIDGLDTLDTSNIPNTFGPFCRNKFSATNLYVGRTTYSLSGFSLNVTACDDNNGVELLDGTKQSAANEGYVYYSWKFSSGGSAQMNPGSGLIHCKSTLVVGTAALKGAARTYEGFQVVTGPATDYLGAEPLYDPMFASLSYISNSDSSTSSQIAAAVVRGLGFRVRNDTSDVLYTEPTAAEIAQGLWKSIAHSTAAIGTLASSNGTAYSASTYSQVAVHVRVNIYAIVAYALLGLWLVVLMCITAWGYRKAFAESLDSYVAARLMSERKDLLSDASPGEAFDNSQLRTPFGFRSV